MTNHTWKAVVSAAAIAATALAAKSFAAALDLAGADRTVTDVADLASYDEGVTNSSATLATLTFDISTDQTYAGVLGGKLKLVKSGTGTLTLSTVTRPYTGGTLVSAGGKLKLGGSANRNQLGTGTITIADGAAIDFNGCINNSTGHFLPVVYAEGTGTDGTGAILNTGTQFANSGFNTVYLTGDLLIYAKNRMNFVTVYTQGHTLRYTGATQSAFSTVNNSQGGDVSIESGQYTAWGTANCLGNTPSKGKVYLRGGTLNFYANLTVPNDIVVEKFSRIRQGKGGSTATFTGTVTLNNNLAVDGSQKVKFRGNVVAPSTKNFQISDGAVDVNFDGCLVSNVYMLVYRGTVTLGNGTTIYSPNGCIKHLMQGSSQVANLTSTFNIADGSDTTVGYFTSGNTTSSTTMTGIVNQVGGTFRTVSHYNTAEYDGIRLGHYSNATTLWNLSGGRLIVEGDSNNLNLSIDGRGELNMSGGEIYTPCLSMCARTNGGGQSTLNLTGGEINIGANGISRKTVNHSKYKINLGGGTIRASHENGFTSPLNMTLTGSSGTNVTFDTQAANVTLSGVLSGVGGLQKTGSGTLTLSGADTYSGATTVKGGTVAFTSAYPGGDLEIDAATLAGASSPVVTAASLAFSSGKGIRILNADTLNKETFGNTKTIAASTAQINALPILTLVAADGTTIVDTGKWHYRLSGDGKTLKFGPHRGIMVLVR